MRDFAVSFVIGLVFGLGLVVSMMMDPLKVLSFLDVAGDWDPSLLLVMAAALVVTTLGYRLVLRRAGPVMGERFHLPGLKDIDARLIGGAALFGVGWGIVGFCPGPAVTALTVEPQRVGLFLLAMVAGMLVTRGILNRRPRATAASG